MYVLCWHSRHGCVLWLVQDILIFHVWKKYLYKMKCQSWLGNVIMSHVWPRCSLKRRPLWIWTVQTATRNEYIYMNTKSKKKNIHIYSTVELEVESLIFIREVINLHNMYTQRINCAPHFTCLHLYVIYIYKYILVYILHYQNRIRILFLLHIEYTEHENSYKMNICFLLCNCRQCAMHILLLNSLSYIEQVILYWHVKVKLLVRFSIRPIADFLWWGFAYIMRC